jgi:propanol-preferring alcohol dehydrogenase
MMAARFHGPDEGLVIEEVERPTAGPGELVVRVEGCGLCHTDLHILDGSYTAPTPVTLGHEIAGTVAETGAGVEDPTVGTDIVVFGGWGCGDCAICNRGEDQLCNKIQWAGGGADGGFAEFVRVPDARYAVPIAGMDLAEAAPLTDAALTPYRAINKVRSRLSPAGTVVVLGVGGLGLFGIQFARTTGARVIAVDLRADRLERARALGADVVVDASEERVTTVVNRLTNNEGVDAVVDFVGTDETLQWGTNILGSKGKLALVGMGGGSVPFAWNPLLGSELEFVTVDWGSLPELREVVTLAEQGRLETDIEPVDFDGLTAAFERLEHGDFDGRGVLVP